MPIVIPQKLPAFGTLSNENVWVIDEKRAVTQDIRPLKIVIVNLMPMKEVTETQLIRLLANTPLQIELQLLHMESHVSKNTSKEHLDNFYKSFEEIKSQKFDGMIITGAPVETIPFEAVNYWKELSEIMAYSKDNVFSTLHICWGAQAGLYYHYGIDKYTMEKKIFGIFPHDVKDKKSFLTRGFDTTYFAPHSRNAAVKNEAVKKHPELTILSESEEAGWHIVANSNYRHVFVQGHAEYDDDTLKLEYDRDINKNLAIEVPKNYFKQDNPKGPIMVTWKSHANLLFSNWLNHCIYPETPYKLEDIKQW